MRVVVGRVRAWLPRTTGAIVVFLAATCLGERNAQAEVDPIATFEWDAPPECPSGDVVRSAVRGITRAAMHAGACVHACVTGPPWVARIRIERAGEVGARRLEASTCEALGHAVALVVAVAIDRAESAPDDIRPRPADALPSTAPTVTTKPAEVGASGAAPPDGRPRMTAYAGVTARTGLLPSLAPGVEAGAGWAFGSLGLFAQGGFFARSSTSIAAPFNGRASGSFLLVTLEARAAWTLRVAAWLHVAPFTGIGVAYLQGEGRGSEVDQSASDWLPMPFGGIEGRAQFGHGIEPYLGMDAGFPLGRSSFAFHGGSGPVHEPGLLSIR